MALTLFLSFKEWEQFSSQNDHIILKLDILGSRALVRQDSIRVRNEQNFLSGLFLHYSEDSLHFWLG
jgi:hypothetical protein